MGAKPWETADRFTEISIRKPAEEIVEQIENLILSGGLKPGDRLPAERVLAERCGTGRGHVREAIRRLECKGILKTLPQSGTYIARFKEMALEGLISSALEPKGDNLKDLFEIRLILEVNAARLAAENATTEDLIDLIRIHETLRGQIKRGENATAADQRFHLKVAECSKNGILCALITLIAENLNPMAVLGAREDTAEKGGTRLDAHEQILQAIKRKDPDRAALAMEEHMETMEGAGDGGSVSSRQG